jgi:hypothetical protein
VTAERGASSTSRAARRAAAVCLRSRSPPRLRGRAAPSARPDEPSGQIAPRPDTRVRECANHTKPTSTPRSVAAVGNGSGAAVRACSDFFVVAGARGWLRQRPILGPRKGGPGPRPRRSGEAGSAAAGERHASFGHPDPDTRRREAQPARRPPDDPVPSGSEGIGSRADDHHDLVAPSRSSGEGSPRPCGERPRRGRRRSRPRAPKQEGGDPRAPVRTARLAFPQRKPRGAPRTGRTRLVCPPTGP